MTTVIIGREKRLARITPQTDSETPALTLTAAAHHLFFTDRASGNLRERIHHIVTVLTAEATRPQAAR